MTIPEKAPDRRCDWCNGTDSHVYTVPSRNGTTRNVCARCQIEYRKGTGYLPGWDEVTDD